MCYPCDACGEPDTVVREAELCMACEEKWCSACQKVQRSRYELHISRRSPDEPLPCNKCDMCCQCFAFDEVR